jgi:hypothetical protein
VFSFVCKLRFKIILDEVLLVLLTHEQYQVHSSQKCWRYVQHRHERYNRFKGITNRQIRVKTDLCRSLDEQTFTVSRDRLSVRLLIDKLNLIMIVLGSTISLCHVTPVAPGGQTINHASTPSKLLVSVRVTRV